MSKKKVVILGAGLCGLRAAVHLLENDFEVDVLEKDIQIGGLAKSHFLKGYIFDHGPHGFYSREEWINEEFKEIVGEGNYYYLEKWSQVHYKGQYFNHPLRLKDLASKMNIWTMVRAFFSFVKARIRVKLKNPPVISSEDFLVNQFGRVLYDEFFGPYTQKVWDIHPSDLDVDFARDRVPHINLWEVIKKLVFNIHKVRVTPSGRVATHDQHIFFYPKQGTYVISEAYANKVRNLNGNIHLSVTITKIDTEAKTVHYLFGDREQVLEYDYLISTIPLHSLFNLIHPRPEASVMNLLDSLQYRAIILVCLSVNKESVFGPFWIYYTNEFFNRISEYKKFSPEVVPPGKTGICLEIGCNVNDELYREKDENIYQRVLPDLKKLDLVQEEEIEDYVIIREPNAYPLYTVGYNDVLNRLFEYIESFGDMFTAGRQGRFSYINQDQAIKSGYEVAEGIVSKVKRKPMRTRLSKTTPAEME